MPIDPDDDGFHGGFNRFIVFRGVSPAAGLCSTNFVWSQKRTLGVQNRVQNNGGIVVRGTSANTLVTGSEIKDSYVGIHVNRTTTTMFGAEGGGVVVVNNSEPQGVKPNFNPVSQARSFVSAFSNV